jgi:hypothetical protein
VPRGVCWSRAQEANTVWPIQRRGLGLHFVHDWGLCRVKPPIGFLYSAGREIVVRISRGGPLLHLARASLSRASILRPRAPLARPHGSRYATVIAAGAGVLAHDVRARSSANAFSRLSPRPAARPLPRADHDTASALQSLFSPLPLTRQHWQSLSIPLFRPDSPASLRSRPVRLCAYTSEAAAAKTGAGG